MGGGSLVKQADTEQVSESLGLLIRSQRVSLNHLAEFREDLEGIVAAHAARRCSQGAGDRLNALLKNAKICVRHGTAARDEFIRTDKQLHLELARITGNPIYISVLHSIHDNIHRYYDRFLSMDRAELEENYQDLHSIVQAVIEGKPREARTLAQDHVRRFNRYMQQREQQEYIGAQKRG